MKTNEKIDEKIKGLIKALKEQGIIKSSAGVIKIELTDEETEDDKYDLNELRDKLVYAWDKEDDLPAMIGYFVHKMDNGKYRVAGSNGNKRIVSEWDNIKPVLAEDVDGAISKQGEK